MTDYLKFQSLPSGRHKDKKHIIIVGAGIMGVCTAYYLVTHPKFDPEKYHITIIESKRVASGASGKAGGLLALWAFPAQIVPLSFDLHQKLSDEYNGVDEWGYRRLTTVSLEGDLTHLDDEDEDEEDEEEDSAHQSDGIVITPSSEKKNDATTENENEKIEDSIKIPVSHDSDSSSSINKPPKKTSRATRQSSIPSDSSFTTNNTATNNNNKSKHTKSKLPTDLNWINSALISNCSTLGGTDTTAQVHPYKFTTFILKKAVELSKGSIEFIIGKVNKIQFSLETGSATGVSYQPSSLKSDYSSTAHTISGDQIVLTVGPWTSKILPDCPISGLRAHSITVAPFKDQTVSPYAIFTEFKTGPYKYISPEIYARQDEVYVCGEGDSTVDVPETTDDVEIVKSKCDELFRQVGKISPNLKKGHTLKRQACYLPVLDVPSSSGPLIGETNVSNLFLASGHSCWGINNAPGTGKIMSELLLDGVVASADISALEPFLYFDASVLVSDDEEDYDDEDDDEEDDEEEEEDVGGAADAEDEDEDDDYHEATETSSETAPSDPEWSKEA
ncbi:oxidoreductase [Scheffersomyces coipomensis]|uniref:oxidoreductase n=1 Tax=Scheffersomyces coipomensis TaxID=1788519 RepID=UPI00315DA69D